MNKENLLNKINELIDDHIDDACNDDKINEMVTGFEIGIICDDFITGRSKNIFQLRLYTAQSKDEAVLVTEDYKEYILGTIYDDPKNTAEKAIILAIELENMANEIRLLVKT
jgi:hypothetical protein